MKTRDIIDRLYEENDAEAEELLYLLENIDREDREILFKRSSQIRDRIYGENVMVRGLLEISSYCKNQCKYCGINGLNTRAKRYRLSKEDIILSSSQAYELGFRTFVLQAGEDNYFTDDRIEEIIYGIKSKHPDSRITLSLGEKDYSSYKRFFEAGADRYLLRHETADSDLFRKIHIDSEFEARKECLYSLKDIGYQVGAGFMVGIPSQTREILVKDLKFLKELGPEMVGLGPFIPHRDTVFRDESPGDLHTTILMLALVRHLLPEVLLPATTALSSLDKDGREKGLRAGANVIMPNISPASERDKYSLYDNKANFGLEAGEELEKIRREIEGIGLKLDMSQGDNIRWVRDDNRR